MDGQFVFHKKFVFHKTERAAQQEIQQLVLHFIYR